MWVTYQSVGTRYSMRNYLTPKTAVGFVLGVVVFIQYQIIVSNKPWFNPEPMEDSKFLPLTSKLIVKNLHPVEPNLTTASSAGAASTNTGLIHQPLSPSIAHTNISTLCATPDAKPNPALNECLLKAIHAVPDEAMPKNLTIFNPKFSISVHRELLEILEVFDQLMSRHNLSYFIEGGTLLGSWRHHGFIPWDDDADVFMDVKDRPKLKEALSQLPPRYTVFDNNKRWIVHLVKRHKHENTSAHWAPPPMDICFYRKDKTHITDIDPLFKRQRWEIDHVFPLSQRPFYHLSLSAPRDPQKVIRQQYGSNENVCKSRWYNHVQRKWERSRSVHCSELYPYLPFVNHTQGNHGHLESLKIGEHVVYTLET